MMSANGVGLQIYLWHHALSFVFVSQEDLTPGFHHKEHNLVSVGDSSTD